MGGLYHLQGFLAKYCITNGFLMTIMYRHAITIVNNKISQYIAKTVVSLSPSRNFQKNLCTLTYFVK